jgi:hypothetical protein
MKISDLTGSFSCTVGQLAGQRGDIQRRLAPGQLARLARRFAGGGGLDDLGDDLLGFVRVLFKPFDSVSKTALSTAGRTSEETSLSLVWLENFGSGTFTESTQVKPSRASSPEMATLALAAAPELAAYLLMTRVSAPRKPARCVPPSRWGCCW